ncbi:NTP transferase domain-containing protein [Paenibacillus silvisoli]|uniref:NTP transferase domain-containing protein n=1 Tax=Paenibacillus silvisoli TaxID=3110539 RepID=UPI002805022D|nr:NTP transferase domain-containing protein [Paenibacillus silvisoli]
MKTAIILAAGLGTKMWPYSEIRPKAMIPVGAKPLIAHQVESLESLGFERVVIVGGKLHGQIRNYFREHGPGSSEKQGAQIVVVADEKAQGTANSLCAARSAAGEEEALVLYGDTLVDESDLGRLVEAFKQRASNELAAVLVNPLEGQSSAEWICCRLADGLVEHIMGHPRDDYSHRFCAFAVSREFWPYASSSSGLFTSVQVGMMPPLEGHLEMSLLDCMQDGYAVRAVETAGAFVDLDKPWHILLANEIVARRACAKLTAHELAEGASIDPSASIEGFVRLGKNSRIGRNVIIEGSIVVGDNTTIENGAILKGSHIIGSDTYIGNYCFLSEGTTVGNRCVVNHCAELDGVIFDTVYLYHYMEFYGVIGMSTDLGAATVCGTLRFDDGSTTHRVKGRRETPREHSNAIYLGDFVRTGVNAILMPGVKVGVYSVIGSGVILEEDVPNRSLLYVKQDLVRKEWGPHKYGW